VHPVRGVVNRGSKPPAAQLPRAAQRTGTCVAPEKVIEGFKCACTDGKKLIETLCVKSGGNVPQCKQDDKPRLVVFWCPRSDAGEQPRNEGLVFLKAYGWKWSCFATPTHFRL
jgi:hypothetical protein